MCSNPWLICSDAGNGRRLLDRAPKLGLSTRAVFRTRGCVPSPDFFLTLHDIGTVSGDNVDEGRRRSDGSLPRAIAEVYAQVDGAERFTSACVNAWVRVMELDRFT